MRLKKKFIKLFVTACCCKMLIFTAVPAHAFTWPVISAAAVASFLNTVTTAASQIGVSTAEITNYTSTIQAVGDQVSTIAKYLDEIDKSIQSIVQNIEEIIQALQYKERDMDTVMKDAAAKMKDAEEEKVEVSEKAVDTIQEQANDINESNEENIDETEINDFIEENKAIDDRLIRDFDDAVKKIKDLGSSGKDSLQALIDLINKSDISDEEKAKMIEEVMAHIQKLEDLQRNALNLIEEMRNEYNTHSEEIANAYNDYKQAIRDYNEGKITKEELENQGQQLKDLVKNAQESTNYTDRLNEFSQQVEDAVNEAIKLGETLSDIIANNKDYPDNAMLDLNDTPNKYVFNFHQKTDNILLKGCYAIKGKKGCNLFHLKGGDESFLLSKELTAKGIETAHGDDGKCQELKFEEIDDKEQDKFVSQLRDCVTRAKTEKTYFWPNIGDEEELAKMDIFDGKTEPVFGAHGKDSYEKKGVYRHIAEDYSAANIITSNQNRQYARSWIGLKADDKSSELNKFIYQGQNATTTRDAYTYLATIELEYLKMYSRIRRVDAINRAKKVVDIYRQLKHLYIDGRDKDFVDANAEVEDGITIGAVKDKVCQKWGDCKDRVISVVSNVFPYFCKDKGVEGKTISLKYEEKNNEGAMKAAEDKVKDCMKYYAEQATNGSTDGKAAISPDDIKREWREKETKAMTDSLYNTFAMATINSYYSSRDTAYLKKSKDVNIAKISEDLGDAKNSRDNYGAGAKINHYGAQQLLTIIDADAQALQSEILEDLLNNVSFDFFDDENPNAKEL